MLTQEDLQREAALDPKFDSKIDYMARIDREVPAWTPPEYAVDRHFASGKISGAALISTNEHDKSGSKPRWIRIDGAIRTQPHFKYVRAVDPQGKIVPLTISTIQANPEQPGGNDGIGTDMRVMSEKKRKGWLILEPSEFAHGKTGLQYIAWALAVSEDRLKRHADYEAKERENFMSQAQRKALEIQKQHMAMQSQQNEAIAQVTAKAVAEAMAANTQAQTANVAEIARAVAEAVLAAKDTKRGKSAE